MRLWQADGRRRRGRRRAARRRPRGAAHRARPRAAAAQGALPRHRGVDAPAPRRARRRARRRQVPARVGVREVRRRPLRHRPLAPRPLPVLRRRRRLLGPRRGGPLPARAGRDRRRRRGRPSGSTRASPSSSPDADERDWLRPRLAALVGAGPDRQLRPRGPVRRLDHVPRARRRPTDAAVVLVIDDAQYADDGLLDFIDHLLGHRPRRRSSSSRWPDPNCSLDGPTSVAARASVIRLDPLDDTAMALARRRTGRRPARAMPAASSSRGPKACRCSPSRPCAPSSTAMRCVPRNGRYVLGRRRHRRPRRHRCTRIAAGPRRRPPRRPHRRRAPRRRRCQRPGCVLHPRRARRLVAARQDRPR